MLWLARRRRTEGRTDQVPLLHQRVGLNAAVFWCLSGWGVLHMAGGLLHLPDSWPTDNGSVLYNLWLVPGRLKYDQFVHAFGFGVTTWLCWFIRRA